MTQKELEQTAKAIKELQEEVKEENKDKQKQKLRDEVIELTKNTLDFPISDCIYYKEFVDSDIDWIIEKLQERIREEEIIYYSRAIKYLYNEDPSLQESLEIAEELGYKPSDLNSEKLATMLYQRRLEEELRKIKEDLEELQDKAKELEEI